MVYQEPSGYETTYGKPKFAVYDSNEDAWTEDVTMYYQKEHTEISTTGSGGTDADAEKIYFPCDNALYWLTLIHAVQNRKYMADSVQLRNWAMMGLNTEIGVESNAPNRSSLQGRVGSLNSFSLYSRRRRGSKE